MWINIVRCFVCFWTVWLLVPPCHAEIRVYISGGSYTPYSSPAVITLNSAANYFITATNTDDDITSITVTHSSGAMNLTVGDTTAGGTIRHINDVFNSSTGGSFAISFDIKGDLGNVNAGSIGAVTVDGAINGNISSSASIGNILAANGVRGNVTANGNIGSISTPTNDIGVSGSARTVSAMGVIGAITARHIYAAIDADSTDADADGVIGGIDLTGNLHGTIKCGEVTQPVVFIDGNIESTGQLLHGENFGRVDDPGDPDDRPCSGDEQIRIGGSLIGDISVLQTAGLDGGQIVINALNTGGTWSGDVKVGPVGSQITLASQTYAETACTPVSLSCDVGCGSVGRVPYFVHDSSCTPAHNGTGTPCNVLMRFYGPVEWDTDEQSFTLERRQASSSTCGGGTWCTVSCADFKGCCINNVNGFGTRNVTFTGYTFQHGFQYRIKPVRTGDGTVTCDLGGGAPVVTVPDDEFVFTLINPCPSDLNCSGCVDGADLSVLLSKFGETNTGCGVGGDVNSDDACNGADLSVLLANFGTDCVEECEGGEGFARRGDSEIGLLAINAFGHNDFNEYAVWVDSMDAEEFADHAIVLQAVLEALLNDE